MKKFLLYSCLALATATSAQAQFLKNVIKKTDSSSRSLSGLIKSPAKGLTNDEIISGLKEALTVGTEKGTKKLNAVDGFFKDAAIKILMPEDAKKVEKKLRAVGMGKQVDDAILSMNRAAEDAARSATAIFVKAIREMSIQDGLGILKGNDLAATSYLKEKTTAALTEAFRPEIEKSLKKVNATKYWNTLFTTYNRFSTEKVETDLVAFVTEKAVAGIFYQIGLEEQKIRKDPMARTSELLKKVFAS